MSEHVDGKAPSRTVIAMQWTGFWESGDGIKVGSISSQGASGRDGSVVNVKVMIAITIIIAAVFPSGALIVQG